MIKTRMQVAGLVLGLATIGGLTSSCGDHITASTITPTTLPSIATTATTTATDTTQRDRTLELINSLTIAAPATGQPYRRAAFGDDWIDADHDCHNTRAEVLIVESTAPLTYNPNGCTVNTGRWTDPWSGYSATNASDFQIDHTVPLADAWRAGAWAWTEAQRVAFANDLDHGDELNALEGKVNSSKSDKTPDQWKPPLTSSWCHYATAWTQIKHDWQLTVTSVEHDALVTMAASC